MSIFKIQLIEEYVSLKKIDEAIALKKAAASGKKAAEGAKKAAESIKNLAGSKTIPKTIPKTIKKIPTKVSSKGASAAKVADDVGGSASAAKVADASKGAGAAKVADASKGASAAKVADAGKGTSAAKVANAGKGAGAAKTTSVAENIKKVDKTLEQFDKTSTVLKSGEKLNLDELGEVGDVVKNIQKGKVPDLTADEFAELRKINLDDTSTFDSIQRSVKNWVALNPRATAVISVVAIAVTGIAIAAAIATEEKNSTNYNITGIEDISVSTTYLAKITFSPSETILIKDSVLFENTNCNPPLPPECTISKIISNTQIEVVIPAKLVANGTSGNMKIKTIFSTQFNSILKDTVSSVAETATSSAAGVVTGVAEAGVSGGAGLAGGVLKGLGLGDLVQYWWVLLIVCLLLMSSSSAIFIFIKFS